MKVWINLIIFSIFCITVVLYEQNLSLKVKMLQRTIDKLQKVHDSKWFSEKTSLNVQIMQLEERAEMLKFCYLCPLYQNKDRENIKKSTQSKQ